MSFDGLSRALRRTGWESIAAYATAPVAAIAVLHLAALGLMAATEVAILPKLIFALTWGLLNFLWLALLRRPGLAAGLSLAQIVILIEVSRLKHGILLLTVSFVDLMIIDTDTLAFLFTVFPTLGRNLVIVTGLVVPLLGLIWWIDPYRVRLRVAATGAAACFASVVGLSFALPMDHTEGFFGDSFVSKFARSGVGAAEELVSHGLFDADATAGQPALAVGGACHPPAKPPHIIMVLDESSYDITATPGVRVPPGYRRHFQSSDGIFRKFVIEGLGGPTWYAEFNVLTGLSVRSFGRFAYFVTRVAAGRVQRGLPQALKDCGYKTVTLYPAYGAFLSAGSFQASAGVQRFVDAAGMGARGVEPDSFYYDKTAQVIARERDAGPVFVVTYLAANHFPWDYRYRPDLTPGWQDSGNALDKVDEYVRRQTMSARDYRDFLARLKRDFPSESFLIVRFGDHQPDFAERLIAPGASEEEMARRALARDPRHYTTYYAIDTINFTPADTSSALETLEAPYLPLVVLEAAGLPLDPTFVEQKKILKRCGGMFYPCRDGAEARRFNRLLIDAGLIKGL
jgi:hypothetical protein